MNFVLHAVFINLSIVQVIKKYASSDLFVCKELLDWQSSLKHECLMTDARCPSLLLSFISFTPTLETCHFSNGKGETVTSDILSVQILQPLAIILGKPSFYLVHKLKYSFVS